MSLPPPCRCVVEMTFLIRIMMYFHGNSERPICTRLHSAPCQSVELIEIQCPDENSSFGSHGHYHFLIRADCNFGNLSTVAFRRSNQFPVVVMPNIDVLIGTSTHKMCTVRMNINTSNVLVTSSNESNRASVIGIPEANLIVCASG